jgi:hypothetical protein
MCVTVGHWNFGHIVIIGIPIVHDCVEVLYYDEIVEGAFCVVEGPGVVVEAKDKSGERYVDLTGHFAVVASSVVVEFSAPWRGSTVIDGGSNTSRNRECSGAKDTFGMDIVSSFPMMVPIRPGTMHSVGHVFDSHPRWESGRR